jgi:hypothetical protein
MARCSTVARCASTKLKSAKLAAVAVAVAVVAAAVSIAVVAAADAGNQRTR